jgi:hypothetical protein
MIDFLNLIEPKEHPSSSARSRQESGSRGTLSCHGGRYQRDMQYECINQTPCSIVVIPTPSHLTKAMRSIKRARCFIIYRHLEDDAFDAEPLGLKANRHEERRTRSGSPITGDNTERKDLGFFSEREGQGEADWFILKPAYSAEESRHLHNLLDRADIPTIFRKANSMQGGYHGGGGPRHRLDEQAHAGARPRSRCLAASVTPGERR